MEILKVLLVLFNLNNNYVMTDSARENSFERQLFVNEVTAVIPYKLQKTNNLEIEYDFKPSSKVVHKLNHLPMDLLEEKIVDSLPVELRVKSKHVVKGVTRLAKKMNLDPIFLVSTIWTESTFHSGAKSKKGAKGYMQLMPVTKKFVKRMIKKEEFLALKDSLRELAVSDESKENIIVGAYYLKMLKKQFKTPNITLAAYNMGPTWARNNIGNKVGENNMYVNKIKNKYKIISRNLANL